MGNHAGLDRYLDDIREDIDELDVLMGRILTFSKLDLNEKPLARKPLDPAELISQLLGRVKPAISGCSFLETRGKRTGPVKRQAPTFQSPFHMSSSYWVRQNKAIDEACLPFFILGIIIRGHIVRLWP
jgi:signal transduction histidine kinase